METDKDLQSFCEDDNEEIFLDDEDSGAEEASGIPDSEPETKDIPEPESYDSGTAAEAPGAQEQSGVKDDEPAGGDSYGSPSAESDPLLEQIYEHVNMLSGQNMALQSQISQMSESIDRLTSQTAALNRSVSVHETIENNLNTELQKYKNDLYTKIATPFLMHLISLYLDLKEEYDDINADLEEQETKDATLESYVKSIKYYLDKVLGALNNCGVEIKNPEPGDPYDHFEQRIVKTVRTDDPEKKEIIESVKTSAFIYNGKVLQPAKVLVYKYK